MCNICMISSCWFRDWTSILSSLLFVNVCNICMISSSWFRDWTSIFSPPIVLPSDHDPEGTLQGHFQDLEEIPVDSITGKHLLEIGQYYHWSAHTTHKTPLESKRIQLWY